MFGKPGSILLSIGNLPMEVTRKDLRAHVQCVIDDIVGSRRWLTSAICRCTILRLTHPATGTISHQGILDIQPARLALDAMERLQERPLRGNELIVSRFRHGSFSISTERPLMGMRELFGMEQDADSGTTQPLKIDLVADTGFLNPPAVERPAQERAAQKNRWSDLFAH